jgi:hypothetical protein
VQWSEQSSGGEGVIGSSRLLQCRLVVDGDEGADAAVEAVDSFEVKRRGFERADLAGAEPFPQAR